MKSYNFRHVQELTGLTGQVFDDSVRLYKAVIDFGIPEQEAVKVACRRYSEAGSVDAAIKALGCE
jgi:hypothetical protein